jgi:hypothetical protein
MSQEIKQPKTRVILVIAGQGLEPLNFAKSIEIEPDYHQTEADLDVNGKPLVPCWQIHSKLSETVPVEEHIFELLKEIAPVRQKFKKLTEKFSACFYCSVEYSGKEKDGFKLSSRAMALVSSLSIDIQFDTWEPFTLATTAY